MGKWGHSYLIELKTSWEKEKLPVTSNFSISHNVFKRYLLLMRQNEYLWSKELNEYRHDENIHTYFGQKSTCKRQLFNLYKPCRHAKFLIVRKYGN